MRDVLKVGMGETLSFEVPREKTVPFLYPESAEFQAIPEVFATGYMIGLMEWCCVRSLAPALEDGEGSLGIAINVSHLAPTPPGARVVVEAEIIAIDGRKISWHVVARDEVDLIGEGTIGRAVVRWSSFTQRVAEKTATIAARRATKPSGTD
ncbi:thioesterase [Rhodospirillum rubrum]|uniref:thioesterase family protein n=1 Tax=Rhodospirillum rubrum TaxID=1085 RepID=UPI001908BC5B|nr:thioesterase family protein [Rhodospirillum rubrum]MBK1663642.1 thioesterase [Rhodospirillum rubrum]MBK1676976.1 thioesterase [Rhodospirillum rubrum]